MREVILSIRCKYNTLILVFKLLSAITKDGELCKVPFRYAKDGPLINKCTGAGTHKGNRKWCATTVGSDLTYAAWDWC